jgi:hypothetical protein
LDGLYLTSFDAKRIRINKKVKDYYESLTLYHQSKESNEEVYVPLVIAEAIPVAEPFTVAEPLVNEISFTNFQYEEASITTSDVKVVKMNH